MKKIDIYYDGRYYCSTTQSKTCKEAKEKFIKSWSWMSLEMNVIENPIPEKVKCRFSK